MNQLIRRSWCGLLVLPCLISIGLGAGSDVDADGVPDSSDVCSNTPSGIYVDQQGRPIGDYDGDCDVDLSDVEWFIANFTGPLTPIATEVCNDGADNDGDDLIDCEDELGCPLATPCSGGAFCSQFQTCGCPEGTADCDGSPQTGCETDTDTDDMNCGQCDSVCDAANGVAECDAAQCVITGCDSGWCDVDTIDANGCEQALNNNPSCSLPPYVRTFSGDTLSDPQPIIGRGEKWLRMHITENNDGIVYLSARFVLQSAPGTDYDLYLYCQNCVGFVASSTATGTFDQVETRNDDDWGSADDYDVLIEIRWKSGACGDYTLTIEPDVATNSNNCDT